MCTAKPAPRMGLPLSIPTWRTFISSACASTAQRQSARPPDRESPMFWEFFRFELGYQLRSPLPWVIGLVFALLAFAATTSDIITIGEGIGNVHRNAPYVILTFLDVFTTLGMFVAVALI